MRQGPYQAMFGVLLFLSACTSKVATVDVEQQRDRVMPTETVSVEQQHKKTPTQTVYREQPDTPIMPTEVEDVAPRDKKVMPAETGEIAIDFHGCRAHKVAVSLTFGLTVYEVVDLEGGHCVMRHGTAIEDPRWDRRLNTTCRVPQKVGIQTFEVHDMGVDFTSIGSYCTTE